MRDAETIAAELEQLKEQVMCYLRELENEVPDVHYRLRLKLKLKEMVGMK